MNRHSSGQKPIGAFFTPVHWAKWVIRKNNLLEQWLQGATVLDPTAGEGSFLEAFISLAFERTIDVNDRMLHRLVGIEKERSFVENFFSNMQRRYHISFPEENFRCEDFILQQSNVKADIVVGNPPWQNFTDLPSSYKEALKPYFFRYHLVSNPKDLLLGGSRIDVAALVAAKCLVENLRENGKAFFFMPLSILLNDSAHRSFRSYSFGKVKFAVEEVYDFKHKSIFEGITTRYGLVQFKRDREQTFPVPYHIFTSGRWKAMDAKPLFLSDAPLSIMARGRDSLRKIDSFKKISIPAECKPRQGVNTCGANNVFIFDACIPLNETTVLAGNNMTRGVELPLKYLFPLSAKENFAQDLPIPRRFILLPHDSTTGRPLEESALKTEPLLYRYLLSQQGTLQKRKGTLINAWIKKGCWWALLGVGRYSFTPYKILWEAYGRDTFSPRIFSKVDGRCWQGNQSLHAYIPVEDGSRAAAILKKLRAPFVQHYLSSQLMEGTCNWAQPGRIAKLLELSEEPPHIFKKST